YWSSLKTPKALANSSPGFERSENPGSQEQEEQTLKALGLCDINPYRVESMAVAIFPGLSLLLQPRAEISERLRRYSDRSRYSQGCRSCSNPGLKLANAFGVQNEPVLQHSRFRRHHPAVRNCRALFV